MDRGVQVHKLVNTCQVVHSRSTADPRAARGEMLDVGVLSWDRSALAEITSEPSRDRARLSEGARLISAQCIKVCQGESACNQLHHVVRLGKGATRDYYHTTYAQEVAKY